MTALSTADPKAPPTARAENARPVAVDRYACGAVNCAHATSSVRGPDCPIPASTLSPIWAASQEGWMFA
ncbi:hypothetical protein DL769_011406 [Monosporascus sp. CRB-8-3]|nr:hypothetical protein DL769_011406 [Monosporascus sp. CRB-8-3]